MARRTFTDFTAKLFIGLGNRTDVTSQMLEHYLNDALRKCANLYEHRQLQAITTGQILAAADTFVPSALDIWWPEHVQDVTDGWQMVPGDKDVIEGRVKRAGPPRRFYTWSDAYFVDTLVNVVTNFKIWYVKEPTYWTAGEPVLDELYDPLIALWALKLAFIDLRDLGEADAVGKEIAMYIAGHKLPTRQQRFNDRNTGIKVRTR